VFVSLAVLSGDEMHVFAACPVEKLRVAESDDSFLYKDNQITLESTLTSTAIAFISFIVESN